MAVKAFADSRYQNECKMATAWSKGFCTAGLQEIGKLTLPIRSSGSMPCCDHAMGTVSARTATIATSPTVVFMLVNLLGPWACEARLRTEGRVLRRPFLEQVRIRLLGDARHARGGDLAAAAQDDLGLADVVCIEIRRREDVARIREVGEGGELGADGAADGALEHAADPAGDSVLGAEGLDVPRCRQTAHAGHLDVDDLAASESDGRLDMGEAERALVEAHGRLDPLLQVGVVDEAHPVVGEGLLDHGEPVTIELAKELGIRRRVGGIAVDVEGEVGEGRADGLDHAQIPAGPELQLDPREARIDGALDLFHRHVEGVLDPEVRPHRDTIRGTAEGAVQGQPAPLGVQYPPRDLESGPGELVALDEGKAIQ